MIVDNYFKCSSSLHSVVKSNNNYTIRLEIVQKQTKDELLDHSNFYFLLKHMFHAGLVTFHNSQQKHNETSSEPPGGIWPHNIRQDGRKVECVHISRGIINIVSLLLLFHAVTCFHLITNSQPIIPGHDTALTL